MTKYVCDSLIIGERLKQARRESVNSMSQLDFALEIGVCVTAISKVEQGQRLPRLDMIVDYMNYFDLDVTSLFIEDENWQEESIDYRLSKLPAETRKYLKEVFIKMLDDFPMGQF